MRIDVHTHAAFWKLYPQEFIDFISENIGDIPITNVEEEVKKLFVRNAIMQMLSDERADKLIKQMDEAEIDISVFHILDFGYEMANDNYSIEEIYEYHHILLNSLKKRAIVFAGIDPRRGKKGFSLFCKGIEEYGFKGLKLYPPCGFSLTDACVVPFYEYCNSHKLPILIHTGSTFSRFDEKSSVEKEKVMEIANRYPYVNFILAHAAFFDYRNSVELAKRYDNVYLDLAGFQNEPDLDIVLEKINYVVGLVPEKVIFGTDWPMFVGRGKQKKWVDIIEEHVCTQVNLKRLIFSDNFLRLIDGGKNGQSRKRSM